MLQVRVYQVYQQLGVGATFPAVGASKRSMPPASLLGARRQAAPLRARSSAGCLLAPTKGASVDCVPLALACQRGSIASAWLPAIRSWRNFSCSWRKHDVAATRIPPGRAPSGRPIERIVPHLLIDSRPGPKSGVGCRLTTLLALSGVPQCEGSSSFRWSWGRQLPCLSATTSGAEAKRSSGHRWEAGTYSQVEPMCQEILYASLQ